VAFGIRYVFSPILGETAVYPLFVLAVMAGTYGGGVGPGALAAVSGYLLADYFFVPPIHVIGRFNSTAAADLAMYTFASTITIALVESLRRVRQKLEADIAARRTLEGQLQQIHAELEQTVARRTAKLIETIHELEMLSYSLSHDLRAPLRAMEGYARMTELKFGEGLSPEARQLLQRIARSAGRLDALIKDVLTYHRTASEALNLHPVNLEALLDELVSSRPELQMAQASFLIERPLRNVLGHEALLTQALSNLLGNAVRFIEPGKRPQVRIWTELLRDGPARGERVRLNIEDNGIGIAPNDQDRIWGIFIRLHPDQYGGSGIGLAIVRKAVESMGGTVGLKSTLGHGSRFWLAVPAAPADLTAESVSVKSTAVSSQSAGTATMAALLKPQTAQPSRL
jgi:signal transduction histidine kinase